jgi:hypothetical protein
MTKQFLDHTCFFLAHPLTSDVNHVIAIKTNVKHELGGGQFFQTFQCTDSKNKKAKIVVQVISLRRYVLRQNNKISQILAKI